MNQPYIHTIIVESDVPLTAKMVQTISEKERFLNAKLEVRLESAEGMSRSFRLSQLGVNKLKNSSK